MNFTLPIRTHCRYRLECVGTKVAQADQWFAAGILDFYSGIGPFVGNKYFVLGCGSKAYHGWGLQSQLAHLTATLDGNPAACTGIIQCTLCAWLKCEFLGAE